MKNLVIGLIAIVFFSFQATAQDNFKANGNEKAESGYIKVTIREEVITYNFNSIEDLTENLEKLIDDSIENPEATGKDEYMVTIEMFATITFQKVTTKIFNTITASSAIIAETAKKVQVQLISIIKP